MGNEESILKDEDNEKGSDYLQETYVKETEVPVDEPGYPEASPPPDKKEDIFNIEHYTDIDNRAQNVPQDKAHSYGELIQYLTQDLKNDLQKLTAVFTWLGQQDIECGNYSKIRSADTPRGFMKLMMEHKGSHAAFLALLCRAAKIPCVIVKGKAKSAGYEVGMTEEECQRLDNSWNAVYVSGGWRLIFPVWAYRVVVGHAAGGYLRIEAGVRQREKASAGVTMRQLNEYYFLTNPENFIFSCFPMEERWQLLGNPWSFQKFAKVPYCRQTYFEEKVLITSSLNCRLQTVDGECTVSVRGKSNYFFDYELYYNEKESTKPISEKLQLQKYVIKNNEKSGVEFTVRFYFFILHVDLKDAIQRRRIDCLDSAIKQAKESKFHNKLQYRVTEAEELRDYLRNMKTCTHDILAMKQSTISEIKRYKQPPQVVHDVMMATYMLLGESRQEMENWATIIYLLGLTGRESLIKRVHDFDPMKVDAETYADVQSLLMKHTEDDVRTASVGAGTFYVWLLKVCDTMVHLFSSA